MARTLLKRLLQLLPVLFGISTIIFFLQRAIPGSPADTVLGPDAPEAQKLEWLARFGFDRPLLERYGHFLTGLTHFDLGRSYGGYAPVASLIAPRLWATAKLAICAFTFSVVLATLVGILAAAFAGKAIDKLAAIVSLLAISAPSFIIGPIALWFFSVKLDWFPLLGDEGAISYVLPSLTLGAALAAFSSRMIRSEIVDVLSEDYIRTARAKGLPRTTVLFKHALRNAFLPTLTVLGMQLGVLFSGTVITEQIFSWPGLGSLTIESVQSREYNVVSGCVLVMACIYVLSNLCVDLLYRVIDPRVRVS